LRNGETNWIRVTHISSRRRPNERLATVFEYRAIGPVRG
jgi:hypothetical protein